MDETGQAQRIVRVHIEGRVQGVGFRYWTERVASELGITGWVRNRRDGTVEGLFCGRPEKVATMLERCWQGPLGAAVTSVRLMEEDEPPPERFEIHATA